MQSIYLTFLILALPIHSAALYCTQTYDLDTNHCRFNFNNPTNSCSIFPFYNCQYTICTDQTQNLRDSSCHQQQTIESSDWNTCTRQCCNRLSPYSQDWLSFSECIDFSKTHSSTLSPGLIIGLVVTSTSLIVLLIFVYCWYCSSMCIDFKVDFKQKCRLVSDCLDRLACQFCINLQNRDLRRRNQSNRGVYNSDDKIEEVTQLKDLKKQWKKSNLRSQKLNDSCCICLQNRPSMLLQCGHPYHRECICQSVRYRRECSLCRSKQFDEITVFCEDCSMCSFKTTLLQHRVQLANSKQICEECMERQYVRQSRMTQ